MNNTYTGTGSALCLEEMSFGAGVTKLEETVHASAPPHFDEQPEPVRVEAPSPGEARGDNEVEQVTAALANDIARILVTAFQNLLGEKADESRTLSAAVRHQEDWLAATAERLTELSRKVDGLAETAAEQDAARIAAQERHEQLAASVGSVRESTELFESTASAIRREMRELSDSMTDRLDALLCRVGMQQEEISAIKLGAGDLSPRVTAVTERLDRQAEAIRSIWETQSQRESVFDQLVDSLSRLKAAPVSNHSEISL